MALWATSPMYSAPRLEFSATDLQAGQISQSLKGTLKQDLFKLAHSFNFVHFSLIILASICICFVVFLNIRKCYSFVMLSHCFWALRCLLWYYLHRISTAYYEYLFLLQEIYPRICMLQSVPQEYGDYTLKNMWSIMHRLKKWPFFWPFSQKNNPFMVIFLRKGSFFSVGA